LCFVNFFKVFDDSLTMNYSHHKLIGSIKVGKHNRYNSLSKNMPK